MHALHNWRYHLQPGTVEIKYTILFREKFELFYNNYSCAVYSVRMGESDAVI